MGGGRQLGGPGPVTAPFSHLFPRLQTFSSLLARGQCPAQSLTPHSSGSPLRQQAGGLGRLALGPSLQSMSEVVRTGPPWPLCCRAGQLDHTVGIKHGLWQTDQRTKSQVTKCTTCRPAFWGTPYLDLGPASHLCPLGLAGGMTLPLPSRDHRFSVSFSTSDSWEAALRRLLAGSRSP